MSKQRIIRISLAAFVVASLIVLWHYNPTEIKWAPQCTVHLLTGLQCPGCGISRATHALLHGRVYEALAYNWFFIVSIPYFLTVCAVAYIPALNRNKRLKTFVMGRVPAVTYVILFCAWFIIRNIYGI